MKRNSLTILILASLLVLPAFGQKQKAKKKKIIPVVEILGKGDWLSAIMQFEKQNLVLSFFYCTFALENVSITTKEL